MKKKGIYLVMAILYTLFLLTACGKKEERTMHQVVEDYGAITFLSFDEENPLTTEQLVELYFSAASVKGVSSVKAKDLEEGLSLHFSFDPAKLEATPYYNQADKTYQLSSPVLPRVASTEIVEETPLDDGSIRLVLFSKGDASASGGAAVQSTYELTVSNAGNQFHFLSGKPIKVELGESQ